MNSNIIHSAPFRSFNMITAGFMGLIAISAVAITLIGLIAASDGPYKTLVSLGTITNAVILGTSIFILILDLFWLAILYKKKQMAIPSQSPPEAIPSRFPEEPLPNTFSCETSINAKWKPDATPSALSEIILTYVDFQTLEECSKIQGWEQLATKIANSFDLKIMFPSLRIFDEKDWATYADLPSLGLDMSDITPLNKLIVIPILQKLISLPLESTTVRKWPSEAVLMSLPAKKGDADLTLLTIPKGLTLNKLIKLAGAPKQGELIPIHVLPYVLKTIGDVPVTKTYRILITNNILAKSRNFSSKKSLIKLVNDFGCELPKVIEVIALLVMTRIRNGERLLGDALTYTCCSDTSCRLEPEIDEDILFVGSFCGKTHYNFYDREKVASIKILASHLLDMWDGAVLKKEL